MRTLDVITIRDGMVLLPGFADSERLIDDIERVLATSPLRQMSTTRGYLMSVATSNCGAAGWLSDRRGYRYSEMDPSTGQPWPAMPPRFIELARTASVEAGFGPFEPDVCLINRYLPGNQMGAHQDRDEVDFDAPIVSVSLGIPARFFVIGPERRGTSTPVDLTDGDVLVFGGPARRDYHGIRKVKPATHPRLGAQRYNLTFRKAL